MNNTLVEEKRALYETAFNEYLKGARLDGFTVHIETLPLEPLRMGNYAQRVVVALANELYRGNK